MNTIKKIGFCIFMTSIVFFLFSCKEQNANCAKEIIVLGSSNLFVQPDRVSISFAAVSTDSDIAMVKNKNDMLIEKLQRIFNAHKILKKDITIDSINIHPRYTYKNDGRREFSYYEIMQNISVLINDINDYEAFLTDILEAGIGNVDKVTFSVKDIKKYRDEARINAVKNAREKAELLCSASSISDKKLSIGSILRISEFPQNETALYNNRLRNSKVYAEKLSYDDNEVGGIFTPVGQIQIEANIEIVFELEENN